MSSNLPGLAIRTAIISLMLAVPVLAVPMIDAPASTIIEAPAPAKTGVGFVLLHILQRR